ncbi:MAG: D-2-hydroxyacid dehydrogenase [Anaerolineales bacterium]|jgi:phosphoglycerate dehydrogenase-like enzyme
MTDEKPLHILFTVSFPAELMKRVRELSEDIKIHSHPTRDAEELPEDLLHRIEVLYTISALPDPDMVPNLRWIQSHYAGIDQIADHPLVASPEVVVTTMSGASAPQMAEFALMSMLALGHRIPEIMRSTPNERWDEGRYTRFEPLEMRGSTVGIIGYGSIGREVARQCHALGAEVLAIKHNLKQLADQGYILEGLGDPEADIPKRIYPPEAIKSMVSLCDFVVVTVPLTSETTGMFDDTVFKAMKAKSYLIDISRGSVVNHGALIEALNSGHLAGAALDVYPIEPLPESSPLWERNNVILSPHLAGASPHYMSRAIDLFAANLKRYLTDEPLLNVYTPEEEY